MYHMLILRRALQQVFFIYVFWLYLHICVPYLYLSGQRVDRCALEASSGASRKCTHAVLGSQQSWALLVQLVQYVQLVG